VSVLFAIVFLFLLMVKFRISIQAHLNKSLNETPQESLHVFKNLIHSFFHSLSLSLTHTHTLLLICWSLQYFSQPNVALP